MLAAGISVESAQGYLNALPPQSVVVACVNSPSNTTLSGDAHLIDQLEQQLQKDGHFVRKLRVDVAYHSPQMQEVAEDYRNAIQAIKPENRYEGSVTMISSVTKNIVRPDDLVPEYWIRNLVSPVQFAGAVSRLVGLSEHSQIARRETPTKWTAFFELGPHTVLKGPVMQILQSINAKLATLPYYGLVVRKRNALHTSLEVAGALWSTGHTIDLCAVNQSIDPRVARVVADLPSYPWNHHTRFWHEPLESTQLRQRKHPRHDILGSALDYQNNLEPRWRQFLRVAENPWIADHVVAGSIVYPAAGMVVMVTEAARQLADNSQQLRSIELHDVQFFRAMVVPSDERGLETALHVAPRRGMSGWYEFGIFSLPAGGTWIQHAMGVFAFQYEREDRQSDFTWTKSVQRIKNTQATAQELKIDKVYEWVSEIGGVTLGPSFQSIANAFFCHSEPRLWLTGVVTDTRRTMPHGQESPTFIHPTTLDALFQAVVLSCSGALSNHDASIPIAVERICLSIGFHPQPGEHFAVHAETQWDDGESLSRCLASDPAWSEPWISFEGVRLGKVPISANTAVNQDVVTHSRYSSVTWIEHIDSPTLHIQLFKNTNHITPTDSHLELRDWIRLLCYTYGDVHALVVTGDIKGQWRGAVRGFAPRAGQRPCLEHVTLAISTRDPKGTNKSSSLADDLQGARVIQIPSLSELNHLTLSEGLYGLVVIDDISLWEGTYPKTLLALLLTMIEPAGLIVLRATNALEEAFNIRSNFKELEVNSTTKDGNFIILRKRSRGMFSNRQVYILSPQKAAAPAFLCNLQDLFTTYGVSMVPVEMVDTLDLTGKTVVSLLEFEKPWVSNWTAEDMEKFRRLLRANYILWVSQSQVESAAAESGFGVTTGLLRTLRNELQDILMPQVVIDGTDQPSSMHIASGILRVLQQTTEPGLGRRPDLEFRLSGDRLMVPRVIKHFSVDETMQTLVHGPRPISADLTLEKRPLRLHKNPEDMSNAYWEECPISDKELPADHIELQVELVTISDPKASRRSPEAVFKGFEAVGTVCRIPSCQSELVIGDKVSMIAPESFGISTRVQVAQSTVVKLPAQLDPVQAVSIPIAYLSAYQSLFETARLSTHSSVLVVGIVNQTTKAIIDCALGVGMQTFVAVSDQIGADFLQSSYPALTGRLFVIHRSLESVLSRLTQGRGVDASICSIGGHASRIAARCLAKEGHFIDLSNEMKLAALPDRFMTNCCTLSSMNLHSKLREKPDHVHALLRRAMDFLNHHGILDHLDAYSLFPVSDISLALEHCKNTGTRAVLDLQVSGQTLIVPPLPESKTLSAHHSYILAGGLGSLGLALATTLVECGARHLIFLGRSRVLHQTQQQAITQLHNKACRTDIVRCDVSKESDLRDLMHKVRSQQWQIKGVIQCTTVLKVDPRYPIAFSSHHADMCCRMPCSKK